jgi:hypothetical protein
MSETIQYILILWAFSIVVGFIWLSIHYYWKNEEKEGRELSPLAKDWMNVSKPAGYFFFIMPLILVPFIWITDIFNGITAIIILIGAPGALFSIIKKGKI